MKLNLGPILKRQGVTQAALAARIGVSAGFVSEIISQKKQPSMETLALIVEALGVTPGEIYGATEISTAQNKTAQDFALAESGATPFQPKPRSDAETILAISARNGRHVQMFTTNAAQPDLGLLAGDKVLIEMNGKIALDDIVICTILDADGTARTHLRRWLDPWLVSGPAIDRLDPANGSAAILGKVIGVLRADFL